MAGGLGGLGGSGGSPWGPAAQAMNGVSRFPNFQMPGQAMFGLGGGTPPGVPPELAHLFGGARDPSLSPLAQSPLAQAVASPEFQYAWQESQYKRAMNDPLNPGGGYDNQSTYGPDSYGGYSSNPSASYGAQDFGGMRP